MTRPINLNALAKVAERMAGLTRGRDDLIRESHKTGFSMSEIADAAGLTRQRVWQIIKAGSDS